MGRMEVRKVLAVVTYDIRTSENGGKGRLRNIQRTCRNWGIPVQHSVFECKVSWEELHQLQKELLRVMDVCTDTVRIYLLGNQFENKVLCLGRPEGMPDWDALVL